MKNDEIALPRPPGCCDDCIKHNAARHAAMFAVHCSHTQTGAFMRVDGGVPCGQWIALSPISAEDFANSLAELVRLHTITVDKQRIM